MLNQFRHLYPQGTIFSELINIERGLYIVKVILQDRNLVLGTGFAAAETIEKAEDRARERALMTVNLDNPNTDTTQIQQSQPQTKTAIAAKPAQNVTPLQTPAIPEEVKTPIQVPQEVLNYHSATETFPVEEATVAIAEPIPSESTPRLEMLSDQKPLSRSFEDILPPSIVENPPVEESQTNIFEQPITPSVEETQTNIFEQPITPPPVEETIEDTAEATETIELDFHDIKHKTDLEMKRLGWTKEQGIDYLLSTYGKRSRLHLTDEELLEFWRYLETLPN